MSTAEPPEFAAVTRSDRDPEVLRQGLETWLCTKAGPDASITHLEGTSANGMSSETLLFEATWGGEEHRLVARVAPDPGSVPVFPEYDLTKQFRAIQTVAAHSDVPVPNVLWDEPDDTFIGAPFFVMERIHGQVPPDVMPYTFGSWLSEAAPEQQKALADNTIAVLAELHGIPDPEETFGFLRLPQDGDTHLRRHVAHEREWYQWATGGERSPLLEECFQWLEDHWPEESPAVVSWGDARIGNVMYRDFAPVAVLDWEMAALGPREIDLGWCIFLHRFFDDLATGYGMPGMPDFLRRDDAVATYTKLTGYEPKDMDWYTMYAATRHGIVFHRTGRRAAHFGEGEIPPDPDDMIIHRATIEAMLAGTYWSSLGQ